MSILKYKTKDGKTRYRVRTWDHYKTKSVSFATKELALEFQAKMKVKQSEAKSRGIKEQFFTFSDFWHKVYRPVKSSRLNPSTLKTYQSLFQNFIEPYFGEKIMSKVGTEEILRYFSTIEGKYDPVYLNKIRQVLAILYNHGVKLRYFTYSPITAIPQYKVTAMNGDFKWWEFADVKKFLDWAKQNKCPRYLLYKMVLEEGGIRPAEAIALKRDQLNLDMGWYRVCRSYNRATENIMDDTKTSQCRVIGLSQNMRTLLRTHLESHDSDYVFPNSQGRFYHYRNLLSLFTKDCKKAGVPNIGLNGMRHTFASHHIMTVGNEIALARIMGHVSTEMLRRYVHLAQDFVLKHSGGLDFEKMAENVVSFPQEDTRVLSLRPCRP